MFDITFKQSYNKWVFKQVVLIKSKLTSFPISSIKYCTTWSNIAYMSGGGVWWWLVMAVTLVQLSDNCKYPNLNMKFDIRKIVERE